MRWQRLGFLKLFLLSLVFMTLVSCMVGPDFQTPSSPRTKKYTRPPTPIKTIGTKKVGLGGKPQRFKYGKNIPAEWWKLFRSRAINRLIEEGINNSPNLVAAKAALVQALENLNAQIGGTLLPQVSLGLQGERQRFSGSQFGIANAPGNIFNVFNASVNASYTLDLFGGLRRQIEAFDAQVDFNVFELEAAHLTLTTNIVTTAFTIASLNEQIKATYDLIKSQSELLFLIKGQFELGGVSKADVLAQESLLAQTRATLPSLKQNLSQNKHALAVLIGHYPSETEIPRLDLNQIVLPTTLPVSVPSLLVRQRPDIRAAEATLHASSAQIGVATANLFPQINITGQYGWQADMPNKFFSPQSNVWNYIVNINQVIFNGGALLAKRRAAIAAFEQSAAYYRQTVLQAFQNVADSLRALENDAKSLNIQRQAEVSTFQTLRMREEQFKLGGVSYISLLDAERQYQQSRLNRIKAQSSRYTDTAALFQSMGGGWWNRTGLDCHPGIKCNLEHYSPECFPCVR